jgi:2-polyprenyl-3-methyl-5-hydroxy-6-metoxy-1,4-benzoquinol methylase
MLDNERDLREDPARNTAGWRERLYGSYVSKYIGAQIAPSPAGVAWDALYYQANLAPHLPAIPGAVLDIGCGHGSLIAYLLARGYGNMIGIDLSAEQVEAAHRLGLKQVEQAEATEYLRQHVHEFDLITAFDVLEHLSREELFGVLDGVYASLNPNGRLVIQTVNGASPMASRIRYGDLTHETAYTPSSVRQALLTVGFRTVSVHEVVIPVHGWKSLIRRVCWRFLRLAFLIPLAIEAGAVRGQVLTSNLIAVADK